MCQPDTKYPKRPNPSQARQIRSRNGNLAFFQIPQSENWSRNFCLILTQRGPFLPSCNPISIGSTLGAVHESPACHQSVNFAFL